MSHTEHTGEKRAGKARALSSRHPALVARAAPGLSTSRGVDHENFDADADDAAHYRAPDVHG
jgi:hypothetical protein